MRRSAWLVVLLAGWLAPSGSHAADPFALSHESYLRGEWQRRWAIDQQQGWVERLRIEAGLPGAAAWHVPPELAWFGLPAVPRSLPEYWQPWPLVGGPPWNPPLPPSFRDAADRPAPPWEPPPPVEELPPPVGSGPREF